MPRTEKLFLMKSILEFLSYQPARPPFGFNQFDITLSSQLGNGNETKCLNHLTLFLMYLFKILLFNKRASGHEREGAGLMMELKVTAIHHLSTLRLLKVNVKRNLS
jgi:hypothetical protein